MNKIKYILASMYYKIGFGFKPENHSCILNMKKVIQDMDGGIEFKIEQYPDGSWIAESVNIDGIITGGGNVKQISSTIKDAIFTYFGIPPHLCREELLKSNNEPVTIKQRVYV